MNISGNAATANLSNEAQHALEADEATISAGAYYLRDAQGSLAIGGPNEPVYFVNGVPTKCNSLKLPQKGDSDTPIYIDANGAPQTCTDFLPLSAGINKKISGSLGLTSEVNYGTSFPLTDNFEGKLFFIEGEEEDDMLYLPPGGSSGQVLIKYSSTDGDAYWGNLSSDYLSLNGGTLTGNLIAPCYITKNYGYDDPNTSGAKTAEGKPI